MVSLSITGEDACCEEGEKYCFLCAPMAVFLRPRIDFGLILLHNGPPGKYRSVFREGLHNFAIIRFPCFSMERFNFLTRSGLFHKGDFMKTLITMMIFGFWRRCPAAGAALLCAAKTGGRAGCGYRLTGRPVRRNLVR